MTLTGRDVNGRPTQISRTVRGGKREAQRAAIQLEAGPASNAGGRTVSDVITAWREVNAEVWSEAWRRDYSSRTAFVGDDPIGRIAVARLGRGPVSVLDDCLYRLRACGLGRRFGRSVAAVFMVCPPARQSWPAQRPFRLRGS